MRSCRNNIADPSGEASMKLQEDEIRLTWTLFLAVATFVVCWITFAIILPITSHLNALGVEDEIMKVALLLSLMSTVFDPIIFSCRLHDIREGFKKCFSP
jgi:hypothetical protein